MAGITPADLAPEVQAILDKTAPEGACYTDQPVCQADSRVTAQLTNIPPDPQDLVRPWRIANAFAGDLIMSPGGPSGMIGGLLSRLDPPQHYSHMAIMISDEVTLRQATSNSDRIEQFYDGSILGIKKAPTNGIEEAALRHQWPGTLTQSVELAYLSWRDHPYERDEDNEPKEDANGVAIPWPGFGFKDEQTGSSYLIDALSFSPAPMETEDGPRLIWPLVVTSCTGQTTSAVIQARRRIARAANLIRGHYRLYGYTRAAICNDPAFAGPAAGVETTVPKAGCSGDGEPEPVDTTIPVVCSTFIWAAVQLANEIGMAAVPPQPRIILDGRPGLPHKPSAECDASAWLHRKTLIDKIDDDTPDGLYYYGEAERQRAASWLHDDYMVPKVLGTVDESLPNVWRDLGIVGGLGVSALLAIMAAVPITVVATILGVTPAVMSELIVLTSDMPDDVANQLCNAFASDDCTQAAKDSDAWKNPGRGWTVSPDNIVNSWAPPSKENVEIIHGLYGWNDRIRMRPPEYVVNPPPKSTWQISQGPGIVYGRVVVRDGAGALVGVPGAQVRIGCTRIVAGPNGAIPEQPVPSGRYWCVAKFTDTDTGLVMESAGEPVEIPDGGSLPDLTIELIPPSDGRREVLIQGHMDLVNRYAVGEDWWGHPTFAHGPTYLGLDYWPDTPEFKGQRDASIAQTVNVSRQVDDWGQAVLECLLEIQADRSVKVTWRAALKSDKDDPWQKTGTLFAPPRQQWDEPQPAPLIIDLVRSEMAWPVRAHIEFTITNDRAP